MMRLQSVHAIYRKEGLLIFANPERSPQDGMEVVVTFLEEPREEVVFEVDPIQALRGRGKGEGMLERLLQSRREDWEHDERNYQQLRV